MSLTRAQLEAYDDWPWITGEVKRYLCPLCGDDHPKDKNHKSLTVRSDGVWHCFRCDASGSFNSDRQPRQLMSAHRGLTKRVNIEDVMR